MPAPQAPSGQNLWLTFARKAEALGATVHHVPDEKAAIAVLKEVPHLRLTRSLPNRFPQLAAAVETAPDHAPDALAPALFAVAETGSVAVAEPAADRAACLLAERLWLAVRADDLVATLDETLARLQHLIQGGVPYATLMSGPSRTADIERTLTIGVHGPRTLHVLVIGAGDTP